MLHHLKGKIALITGGTRGIGLSVALALGKFGVKSILTYRWGSDEQDALLEKFRVIQAPEPFLICADVASSEDNGALFNTIAKDISQIDIFVSNVSQALRINSFDDYSLKGLKQSISYSAWPLYQYTKKIHDVFGKYPRYIVGVSSTGPDHYSIGYDFVAASKIVLETLCKYMTYRLRHEDVCINVVRSRAIKTKSFDDTFGKDLENFASRFVPDNYWIEADEVANAIVALCSGWLDAMRGQIINVDRGTTFFDNLMDLYTRKDREPIINRGITHEE